MSDDSNDEPDEREETREGRASSLSGDPTDEEDPSRVSYADIIDPRRYETFASLGSNIDVTLPPADGLPSRSMQVRPSEVFLLVNDLIQVENEITTGLASPRGYERMYEQWSSRSYGKVIGYLAALRDDGRDVEWDLARWNDCFGVPIVAASTNAAHSWQIFRADEDDIEEDSYLEVGEDYLDEHADPTDISRVVFENGVVLFGGTLDPVLMEISDDEIETVQAFVEEAERHREQAAEMARFVNSPSPS